MVGAGRCSGTPGREFTRSDTDARVPVGGYSTHQRGSESRIVAAEPVGVMPVGALVDGDVSTTEAGVFRVAADALQTGDDCCPAPGVEAKVGDQRDGIGAPLQGRVQWHPGVDAHAGCGIYNSGQGRAFIVDDKGLPAQVGSAGGFDPQGEVWDQ